MRCDRAKPLLATLLALAAASGAYAQSGRVRNPQPAPAPAPAAPKPTTADPGSATVRAAPIATTYTTSANYEGGSVTLKRDTKVTVTIKDGLITFEGGPSPFDVPVEKVTDITYGQSMRSRTAEGVGVGVLVPGAGPVIGGMKSAKHYVEIVWQGEQGGPAGGIVLRLDKDDYRAFLTALEAATGVKVHLEGSQSRDF